MKKTKIRRTKVRMICALCDQARTCFKRQIEGKDYKICSECWNPLAEKLKGKGREKMEREMVFLPPLTIKERGDEEPKPLPGGAPKIWARTHIPH